MKTRSATKKDEGIAGVGFDVLCGALAEIKRCDRRGAREAKRAILSGLFRRLSTIKGKEQQQDEERLGSKNEFVPSLALEVDDSYMVLRLIAPEVDRERNWFGLKELSIAKEYIKALNLSKTSAERKWLLNYMERDFMPSGNPRYRQAVFGSFTSVLEAVLSQRCPRKGTLTIGRANELLDVLIKNRPVHYKRIVLSGNGTGGFGENNDAEHVEKDEDIPEAEISDAPKDPKSTLSDKEQRTDVFRELLETASAEENAWFIRIIMKNLEARLGYERVLEWYNPSGLKCYKQTHSLKTVVENCSDPKYNITRETVTLGLYASVLNTARPSRKGLDEVTKMLKFRDGDNENPPTPEEYESRCFFMEPKIDGERLVAHKVGSDVVTFSRKANSTTHIYGTMLKGILNDVVHAKDAILDGEVYLVDKVLGSTISFEEMRKKVYSFLKHETLQSEQLMLVYCVFDVLYVDQGKEAGGLAPDDVLHLSCEHRRQILKSIIKPISEEKRQSLEYDVDVKVIHAEKGRSSEDIKRQLEKYVDEKYEGLIAKNCAMPYALGERNLKFAAKLKPDYFDGGIVDIDAIIVGAKFGTGTQSLRMGTLSSFFLAVVDQDAPRGIHDEPTSFICVGSVGTGYSVDILRVMQAQMEPHWEVYDPENEPSWCDFHGFKPERIIHPQHSIILTVKAVELFHVEKYTLRFPRVQRVRLDKPWTETITLEELKALNMNKNPLTIKADEEDIDDIGENSRKRSKPDDEDEPVKKNKRVAMAHMKAADLSDVVVEKDLFNGISFLVYGSTLQPTFKADVERMIASLGGTIVQNMCPEVTYMVADCHRNTHVGIWKRFVSQARMGNKAASKGLTKDGGDRSIILPKWIDRCKEQNKVVPLRPTEVLHASEEVQERMMKIYDSFGDKWKEPTTVESLTESFALIDQLRNHGDARVKLLSKRATKGDSVSRAITETMKKAGRIFYGDTVALDPQRRPSEKTVQLLRFYGANIVEGEEQSENATYLLTDGSEGCRRGPYNSSLKLISEEWVWKSTKAGKALPLFVDPK